jgi:hypothetical protein
LALTKLDGLLLLPPDPPAPAEAVVSAARLPVSLYLMNSVAKFVTYVREGKASIG